MAEPSRRKSARNPQRSGVAATAGTRARVVSRLDLIVAAAIRDALRAALDPANHNVPFPFGAHLQGAPKVEG